MTSAREQQQPERGWARVTPAMLAAVLLSGCATGPKPMEPVYYPALPSAPRIQFLTSYSAPEDFEKPRHRFWRFVLGNPPPRQAIVKPYGVTLDRGKLFACDTVAGLIHELDLNERTWRYLAPIGPGRLRKPIHTALDPDATLYIADATRGQVVMLKPGDYYAGAIGSADEMKPTDVAVVGDRLYITDLKGHRVLVYDRKTRERLFTIPRDSENEQAALFSPTNLAIGPDNTVYVSDTGAFRIQQYDAEGAFIRSFGEHGDAPGQFARNKGIAVDRDGRLYTVDAASQTVQIFDPDGKLLLFFGEPGGSPVPLTLPAAITIDYDHLDFFRPFADPDFELEYVVCVTSQYGSRKLMFYGFGHKR